jgi:hypothetical protein
VNLIVELERDDNLTVRQWEEFLAQARRAGAGDDTSVDEHMAQGTDVLVGYRVTVEDPDTTAPEHVVLPTWLMHDLLSVVKIVATSDGDVRGLGTGAQKALQSAYDHLLLPVLGENPYADDDEPTGAGES